MARYQNWFGVEVETWKRERNGEQHGLENEDRALPWSA